MTFTDSWQFACLLICVGLFLTGAVSIVIAEVRVRKRHRRTYRIIPGFGHRVGEDAKNINCGEHS